MLIVYQRRSAGDCHYLVDEYDYDDESKDATNENDHNDEYVIDEIVILYFVDFFNNTPLNK